MKVENLDQVEAWKGGAILPPGRHYVRIESAEEGTSSGDHPEIRMEFASEAGLGSIRAWQVVIPSSYGKVKQLLDAVMIESESGEWELPVDKLAGRKLWIIVGDEPDGRGAKNPDGTPKMRRVVQAYEPMTASDVPGDTRDLPGTQTTPDGEPLPF